MKKNLLLLSALLMIMIGCTKLDPAEMTLNATYDSGSSVVTGNVVITYNGGPENFTEQGYIYSYFATPSLTDRYGTPVVVNKDVQTTVFDFTCPLPAVDTVMYIRAYTKTNGGVGYSNIVEIHTTY